MGKLNVIVTGSTGMVGEGVLYVCLNHPAIEKVLVINRKPVGVSHPKLTEIIHPDFYNLQSIEDQLTGYDACYFCLGITSVGAKPDEYYNITYNLTLHFGQTLSRLNAGMVFCYVSGAGTDGTEKGRLAWARVKGKTENDLMKLPFKKAYGYRPAFIKPIKGLKYAHKFYNYINWMFPIGKRLAPKSFNTLEEVGLSMIYLTQNPIEPVIVDGKLITQYAKAIETSIKI